MEIIMTSSNDKTTNAAASAPTNGRASTKSEAPGVTFKSRSPNFTLYLHSPTRHYGPHGEMEYRGEFRVKFINNHYSTNDPQVIEAMRRAKSFGTHFQEVTAPASAKPAA